jgi:hypothetical protein
MVAKPGNDAKADMLIEVKQHQWHDKRRILAPSS